LIVYLVLVWFVGSWLPLHGSDRWILRGGLWLIGLVGAGTFLWFYRKKKAEQAHAATPPGEQPGSADVDLLVHEAVHRLKGSTLGRGASLGTLPLFFLLGESGSTKTTTVIHSALDPELLAGHVYQDNNIIPTRVVNIWYTREAIFVDPAGNLLALPERWKRLVKMVQAGRVSSAMGKGQQAPRAAIVCFDCGNFLQPGASEAILSAARKLAVRLQEISQLLSVSFPVYVLFTKLDRISFFPEFAGSLSKEEASEVLGATLPIRSLATGVYAEEETKRLTKAFDEIFYSLAEKRLELLGREYELDKLPGIYEFPRELRKLRPLLVQFLVDLGRPSQLTVNPFLRGFYFSGVRPVIVDDVVHAAPQGRVQASESEFDAGATRIFSSGGGSKHAPATAPARVAGSRKIPQWVFLTQLFNDVIVKDRVAMAASGFSSRVNLLRRLALGFVALVALVCAIGFLISFVGNHALESNVRTATEELRTVAHLPPKQLPSLDDLEKLERLRKELVNLSTYQTDGVPFRLRWGLYVGDRIYPDAKTVYFERFRNLLFDDTQSRLLIRLRSVPAKPGPNDSYAATYDELKAYLITTSKHEKSTKEWLSPVLTNDWTRGRDVGTDSAALAKSQFDFYSTELAAANPFSSKPDDAAVKRARDYLGQFAGIDHIYKPILDEVSSKFPDVSFNEQFGNSTGVIASSHKVRGAFTRSGFASMTDAIRNVSHYISGEDWVLGKITASELDQTTLQPKLTAQYQQDFIREWRSVLTTSHVTDFKLPDAADRLDKLSSSSSPMLELLWFIAQNTDVGVREITDVFAPVDAIEKPGPPDQLPTAYVNPDNNPYVSALTKLQDDIANYLRAPDPNHSDQALNSALAAKSAAKAATSGHIDQRFHTEEAVRQLLEEPIKLAESGLTRGPVETLNAAGQGFCQKFGRLRGFYPFSPTSTNDLPIDDLNMILAPGKGLWAFYDDAKLSTYLARENGKYVANSSAPTAVHITPDFLLFFNQIVALSEALYPQASTTPHFSYGLRELHSEGLALKIGTDTVSGAGQQRLFNWTGNGEEVQIATTGGEPLQSYEGPWAVFKFVRDSHPETWRPVTNLEWILQIAGKDVVSNGKKKSYTYELQVNGINPFRPAELSGLRCVPTVAK
jgi:type VI secretion system protein ImpL